MLQKVIHSGFSVYRKKLKFPKHGKRVVPQVFLFDAINVLKETFLLADF